MTEEEKQRLLIQKIRKNVEKGRYEKLEKLVCEIDLNCKVELDSHWTRFIHISVSKALLNYKTRSKYLQITKLLLQNGADIQLLDEFGHACHDDIDKCSQLIQLFVKYGKYDGPFIDLIDE